MPARQKNAPKIVKVPGVSFNKRKASKDAPTGSPIKVTEITRCLYIFYAPIA